MTGKDQEIQKFDGSNFALWKNKMRDVLIQKMQLRPLSREAKRPEGMINDNRKELDLLAMSTIRLDPKRQCILHALGLLDCDSTEKCWTKLYSSYEKETASNKFLSNRKTL